MDTIGIGFIGTGFAKKVQMPALAACEGAKIVSIASGDLENARSAAAEFGAPRFTADWRETVADPEVDLVCITTPPSMHREMALAAIEYGKHILCEKPMAMNVEEAEEMTAAAAAKPALSLIDHELRFQPGRLAAKRLLADGHLGKIRHVKTLFQAPHRGDPSLPFNWWSDAGQGGGALGAINSHIIDSLHWFLGTSISSVYCQLHTNIKDRRDVHGMAHQVTSDDEANMLVRFADAGLTDDATGLVSVSMTEGPGYTHRMEFYGERGFLRVEHDGSVFTASRGQSDWVALDVDLGKPIAGVADTGFARAFWFFAPQLVSAIRSGMSSIPEAATFGDGLKVQKVLDAARASHADGRRVDLFT
jgi:predicted dehydrogenase